MPALARPRCREVLAAGWALRFLLFLRLPGMGRLFCY